LDEIYETVRPLGRTCKYAPKIKSNLNSKFLSASIKPVPIDTHDSIYYNHLSYALAVGIIFKKTNWALAINIKALTFRLKSKRNFSLSIHRLKPVAIKTFALKDFVEFSPSLMETVIFQSLFGFSQIF